jgi:hypothetical protein
MPNIPKKHAEYIKAKLHIQLDLSLNGQLHALAAVPQGEINQYLFDKRLSGFGPAWI